MPLCPPPNAPVPSSVLDNDGNALKDIQMVSFMKAVIKVANANWTE